jgi:predicted RNA binding protein YcfA (HicA-like mRNA interferase family)
MPPFGPISRINLIRCLRRAGFCGPYSGGNHQFMLRGDLSIALPNPHRGDIGKDLLSRILKQASVKRREWERL